MRSPVRPLAVLGIVLLVATAGCLGGAPAAPGGGGSGGDAGPGDRSGSGPVVNFYVSDRPNDINDFEHLNVTIESVELHGSDAGKVERDVNDTTVDLTRLVGDNATLVDSFDVPEGNYSKVFLHVGDVNPTLEGGGDTRVKLPSEKLHLNERFSVGPNSSVDFVFDISVHKAGKSGKYILKPVVSESGTDVPIDERGEGRGPPEDSGEDGDEGDESSLDAAFAGNVTPGENVTVRVTDANGSVANATVLVDDRRVGTTDADGRITLEVPAEAEKLKVKVRSGDREAELEVEFEEREEDGDDDRGDGNGNRGGGNGDRGNGQGGNPLVVAG